jgi:hypothetical protein
MLVKKYIIYVNLKHTRYVSENACKNIWLFISQIKIRRQFVLSNYITQH